MTIRILRRRRLGGGSSKGIIAHIPGATDVRSWIPEDGATVQPDDIVVRWGCTATLPAAHEGMVINNARAIHWCSDKRQGRLDMQAAGVPVPETFAADPHWFGSNESLEMTQEELAVRYVARPVHHAQGRQLEVGNFNECQAWCWRWGGGYVARLIPKVAEYRFFVAQNRLVWCAKKTPGNPDQVAWNVSQGGRFDNVRWDDWPIEAAKACLAAARVSGTDFCGVDVMVDEAGLPYVLEVNSAPSLTSPYRQQCVARVFSYIEQAASKAHFPDPANIRTYKSMIHPAIREPRN